MVRRSGWICAALVALLALSSPAFAGGWAVVTLDALPSKIEAGQTISLGFMVRQHGVTPIDKNPWESTPLQAVLFARSTATGETIQANSRKEGPLGHFVVDVTFPSAGSWEIEIIPPPFAGTKLGVFTVAAATTRSAVQQGTDATIASPAIPGFLADRSSWVWGGMALVLLVALTLTAWVQRESLARLLAGRNPTRARPADEPQPAHSRVA